MYAIRSYYAFGPDTATHKSYQLAADWKAESGSTVLSHIGIVDLFKGIEYLSELVRRNTDAGVGDAHVYLVLIGDLWILQVEVEADWTFFGKFDRIANQVQEDLPQAQIIASYNFV